LTNVLQPRAVLALTATAAPITRISIHQLLRIPQEQEVVESPLRDNLRLRVLHVATGATKSGSVATHIVQLLKTGEKHEQPPVLGHGWCSPTSRWFPVWVPVTLTHDCA
jgi:superfamily II DNA helicase RecQ